jgi:hypothetical protein
MPIKRFSSACIATCAASVALTACAHHSSSQGGTKPHTGVVHHIDASWAETSSTIEGMTAKAAVVVEGVVSGVTGSGTLADSAGYNLQGAPEVKIPYTEFGFRPTSVVKGKVAPIITIRQTGGTASDGSSVVLEDDPLLSKGEHCVLFLKPFGTNRFYIMGGPSGRLNVTGNGTVQALPDTSLKVPPAGSVAFLLKTISVAAKSH